ncbi:MAG: PAC2 family protein [Nitrososphaerota archaeon]
MSGSVAPYVFEKKRVEQGAPVIEGLPEVGLVGTITAAYIASSLGGDAVGYIEIPDLPPIVTVLESRILEPCRLYSVSVEQRKLLLLYSDVPVPPRSMWSIANSVTEIASTIKSPVISVGGIPEPDRLDIEKPKVYVLSNDEELVRMALATDYVQRFENGYLTGVKAAILKSAAKRDVRVLLALVQSHMNYPDPGAAAEVVTFLNKLLGMSIPVAPLLEQAEQLKMQMRDLMRRTSTNLSKMPIGLQLESPPGYIK